MWRVFSESRWRMFTFQAVNLSNGKWELVWCDPKPRMIIFFQQGLAGQCWGKVLYKSHTLQKPCMFSLAHYPFVKAWNPEWSCIIDIVSYPHFTCNGLILFENYLQNCCQDNEAEQAKVAGYWFFISWLNCIKDNSDINLEHGKEDIVFISSVYLRENIGTLE